MSCFVLFPMITAAGLPHCWVPYGLQLTSWAKLVSLRRLLSILYELDVIKGVRQLQHIGVVCSSEVCVPTKHALHNIAGLLHWTLLLAEIEHTQECTCVRHCCSVGINEAGAEATLNFCVLQ
jgi:hypothetical protein